MSHFYRRIVAAGENASCSIDVLGTVLACAEWGWIGAWASVLYWTCRRYFKPGFDISVVILRGAVLRWIATMVKPPAMFAMVLKTVDFAGVFLFVVGLSALIVSVICEHAKSELSETLIATRALIERLNSILMLNDRSVRLNLENGRLEFFNIASSERKWHLEDIDAVCALSYGEKCPELCAICGSTPKLWRTLPCNHVFCAVCGDTWLMLHGTCPLCRHVVFKPQCDTLH